MPSKRRKFEPVKIERGKPIEKSTYSSTFRAKATTKTSKDREKTFSVIEKTFLARGTGEYLQKTSKALRKIGLSAVVIRKVGDRWLINDISRGGKRDVKEFWQLKVGINPEVKRLDNYKQIEEEITNQSQKAASQGYTVKDRAWLIAVDPKTNKGKPYLADLKHVNKL